jgi:hypothetical protein
MTGKIIFNGTVVKCPQSIKKHVDVSGKFSGYLEIKLFNPSAINPETYYCFSNVNSKEFDYYVNIFNNEINLTHNKEVTLEIQTNVNNAKPI